MIIKIIKKQQGKKIYQNQYENSIKYNSFYYYTL